MFKHYFSVVFILIHIPITSLDLTLIHEAITEFTANSIHQASLEFLKGGMTGSQVVKFADHDKTYVLKTFSDTNKQDKIEYHYARHASELGIGPHLYSNKNQDTNYIITEFIFGPTLTSKALTQNSQATSNKYR